MTSQSPMTSQSSPMTISLQAPAQQSVSLNLMQSPSQAVSTNQATFCGYGSFTRTAHVCNGWSAG
jgi:hypothetical protein